MIIFDAGGVYYEIFVNADVECDADFNVDGNV